ncbi:MAG: citramalate synthase, partial [Verrucomicrobia bacterium]|nr:citramalate synthase [Verrucomicrobiota bacterium]
FLEIRKRELTHAKVVAFGATRRANTRIGDDPMVKSMLETETPAVAIVGKSWDLHVRDVLRTTDAENMAMIRETVAHIKDHQREVLFDAEHFFDGYKRNPEFAMMALQAAIDGGADVLVLCDTNGGTLPSEIESITNTVVQSVKTPIAIHVHNDMGLAVANSIVAVHAGAIQIQGTINGYGERTGNANLVSIIPILELKLGYRCVHEGQLVKLSEVSRFVDELTNQRPDTRAPFVGKSSFSHKAGQHANAVGKNPATFEHIPPESVGNARTILVSELSGGSNILLKAVEMGIGRKASAESKGEILAALKEMESKGYTFEAADASFQLLIQKVLKSHKSFFDLEGYRVIVEKRGANEPCLSEATVKVLVNGEMEQTVSEGEGPVDALNGALRKALKRFYPQIADVFLMDYRVRIMDPEEATGAKTQVIIESGDGKNTWGTVGVSENIIEASWEALVDSVEFKLFQDERGA